MTLPHLIHLVLDVSPVNSIVLSFPPGVSKVRFIATIGTYDPYRTRLYLSDCYAKLNLIDAEGFVYAL